MGEIIERRGSVLKNATACSVKLDITLSEIEFHLSELESVRRGKQDSAVNYLTTELLAAKWMIENRQARKNEA